MPVKNKEQIQYKQLKFDIKSTKEDKENGIFTFEGYLSIFGEVDSYNDTVLKGAYKKDLLENGNIRPCLWQHRSSEPLGTLELNEDEIGLYAKGSLPLDDDFVRGRVVPQLKFKTINGMSIGYWTIVSEYNDETDIRTLKELKLVEGSIVTFPADDFARITDMKKADFTHKWNRKTGKEIKDESLLIAGLPIGEEINGEPTIIPKAVFAARVEMAKGEYSESEKKEMNGIYNSLNMESPFEQKSKVSLEELKNLSKSDRAWVIKNLDLSTKASNHLAELLVEVTKDDNEDSDVKTANGEKFMLDGFTKINNLLKNK